MKLILREIVTVKYNRRSIHDKRKKVNYAVASYTGEHDGQEYRKGFEFIPTRSINYIKKTIPQFIDTENMEKIVY